MPSTSKSKSTKSRSRKTSSRSKSVKRSSSSRSKSVKRKSTLKYKSSRKTSRRNISKSAQVYKGKRCDTKKSKNNPNAYTKEELIEIAVEHLNLTRSMLTGMDKLDICRLLNERERFEKKKHNVDCIARSKLPLKPHQIKVVQHLRGIGPEYRGVIAAFQTGAGKTLTAVAASQCFLDRYQNGQIIVVTPKSLIENFRKEMRAYGENPTNPAYIYFTYDGFRDYYKDKDVEREIPTMLIMDEAHHIKAIGGSTAHVALKVASQCTKVLLMSATILYNRPVDLINPIAMVKGDKVPMTENMLEQIIADEFTFKNYLACTFAFFDVMEDENYPSYTEKEKIIRMSEKYYKSYLDVQNSLSIELYYDDPYRFYLGLRQAGALEESPKVDWVARRCLKNDKKDRKTIVFSEFLKKGIHKIRNALDDLGVKYAVITGEMSDDERLNSVRKYNSTGNDGVNILLISKAGGEGLDLKGTREVIVLESTWSRQRELQIRGRAVRYGSHAHLPPRDRNVTFIKVLLKKPEELDFYDSVYETGDEIVKRISVDKETVNNYVDDKLRNLDIIKYGCTAPKRVQLPKRIIKGVEEKPVYFVEEKPKKKDFICKELYYTKGYTVYQYDLNNIAVTATKDRLAKLINKLNERTNIKKRIHIYPKLEGCKLKNAILLPNVRKFGVEKAIKSL